MLNTKKIFTMLLVICIFLPSTTILKAENNSMAPLEVSGNFELENIKGVYRGPDAPEEFVETNDDLNYLLEKLKLNFGNNTLEIITEINDETIQFKTGLYPSQLGTNTDNTLVVINDKADAATYDILKFTIENDTNSNSLLAPNMYMVGKTVASFGLYNKKTLEKYYFQFVLENFNFEKIYDTASIMYDDTILSTDSLLDKEVAYFTLQPVSDFKSSFQSINSTQFSDSSQTSSTDIFEDNAPLNDLKGEVIDQLIELSKIDSVSLSNNIYSLISDIPDELYKKQENGTWTNGSTGWTNGNKVGYTVYHMNDPFSGNALNYVLRYYISSRFNWSSQQFDTSFNLSHNVWVQYIKSSNTVYVFDDRASNARIIISPTIYLFVTDTNTNGYFNSKMTNAYKNGSIAKNIAQLIIGYVPKLGTINKIYKTLTNDNATGNNSKQFFEMNYTREAQALMTDLKYAPNDRNYAQDYVGITIWATDVNSITNGYEWTCYAK